MVKETVSTCAGAHACMLRKSLTAHRQANMGEKVTFPGCDSVGTTEPSEKRIRRTPGEPQEKHKERREARRRDVGRNKQEQSLDEGMRITEQKNSATKIESNRRHFHHKTLEWHYCRTTEDAECSSCSKP